MKASLFLSALGKCFKLLDKRTKKKLSLIGLSQVLLSFLDLVGVALIGLVAALTLNGINSREVSGRIGNLLELMKLSDFDFQKQVVTLALITVIILISKTLLSIFLIRKTLFFLSVRGAELSKELFSRVISQDLQQFQRRSSQEYIYTITSGTEIITLRIIAPTVNLLSDISLLLFIIVTLFMVDPLLTGTSILTIGVAVSLLQRVMHKSSRRLGVMSTESELHSREKAVEAFGAIREITVKNSRSFYVREFGRARSLLYSFLAERNFQPYASKYFIEATLLLSALTIAAVQFFQKDAIQAITSLSLFLAAGSRIAPAILRLQQGAVSINNGLGVANETLKLIDDLRSTTLISPAIKEFTQEHLGFNQTISISNLSLRYRERIQYAIEDINLEISRGQVIAFVGPSGAGKTSLIDVLLGMITPTKGEVRISGLLPKEAIEKWPGAIAYVPQEVFLARGSIAENICLGFPSSEVSEEKLWHCLKTVRLDEFVNTLPQGIHSLVGERGAKLSGGQRQRLGIARALITNPKILVLDEATSALDSISESEVSSSIESLKGQVTVLMIAHRLSTAQRADLVVYMKDGRIQTTGSFDHVRRSEKDFDLQAKLMGLV
jgi:ATP-binding cassette subfamily C protein